MIFKKKKKKKKKRVRVLKNTDYFRWGHKINILPPPGPPQEKSCNRACKSCSVSRDNEELLVWVVKQTLQTKLLQLLVKKIRTMFLCTKRFVWGETLLFFVDISYKETFFIKNIFLLFCTVNLIYSILATLAIVRQKNFCVKYKTIVVCIIIYRTLKHKEDI